MYTKKYLKEHKYKFLGTFAYTAEIWVRGRELLVVNTNTRKLMRYVPVCER